MVSTFRFCRHRTMNKVLCAIFSSHFSLTWCKICRGISLLSFGWSPPAWGWTGTWNENETCPYADVLATVNEIVSKTADCCCYYWNENDSRENWGKKEKKQNTYVIHALYHIFHKTPLLTEMIASYDEVTSTDFEIDCDSENKNETYSETVDLLGHIQNKIQHIPPASPWRSWPWSRPRAEGKISKPWPLWQEEDWGTKNTIQQTGDHLRGANLCNFCYQTTSLNFPPWNFIECKHLSCQKSAINYTKLTVN